MKTRKAVRGGRTLHLARTLEWLRSFGCIAEREERRCIIIRPGMPPGMGKIGPTQDLLGVADCFALPCVEYINQDGAERGPWYVQVCALTDVSPHRKKALAASAPTFKDHPESPVLPRILLNGGRFIIVAWEFRSNIHADGSIGASRWHKRIWEYYPTPDTAGNGGFLEWNPFDYELCENAKPAKPPKAPRVKKAKLVLVDPEQPALGL